MKLLLDENLSRRLVPFLQNEFPGSTQVALVGLEQAKDLTNHAREHGYTIVTRDADFEEISAIRGAPPQVIWIRMPNQGRAAVLKLLLQHRIDLEEALREEDIACIELGPQGVDR